MDFKLSNKPSKRRHKLLLTVVAYAWRVERYLVSFPNRLWLGFGLVLKQPCDSPFE
jgi:hypothetical protein